MSFYNSQKAMESLSRKYSSTKVSPNKTKKPTTNEAEAVGEQYRRMK